MVKELSAKIFSEFSEYGFLGIRMEARDQGWVITELRECGTRDEVVLKDQISALEQNKRSGFVVAKVGFYPTSRVFLRASLDEPKRGKDSQYLSTIIQNQVKIDSEKYALVVLHPRGGVSIDFEETPEKEVLFAGVLDEEAKEFQKRILGYGLYPQSLEISSLATVGALLDYLDFTGATEDPTLVLELGMDHVQAFILQNGAISQTRLLTQGLSSMVKMVQKELGLKDEKAALRLFYSDTFDFQEMGPRLIGPLLREVNAYSATYEVETGQTIGQVHCTLIPGKLSWLNQTLAKMMVVDPLVISYPDWLKSHNIHFRDEDMSSNIPLNAIGVFGLIIDRQPPVHEQSQEKEEIAN